MLSSYKMKVLFHFPSYMQCYSIMWALRLYKLELHYKSSSKQDPQQEHLYIDISIYIINYLTIKCAQEV